MFSEEHSVERFTVQVEGVEVGPPPIKTHAADAVAKRQAYEKLIANSALAHGRVTVRDERGREVSDVELRRMALNE